MRKDHLLIGLTGVAFLMATTACSDTSDSNETGGELQSERGGTDLNN
ncbi:hypothetical protein [Bacillus sp. JCM 19041]